MLNRKLFWDPEEDVVTLIKIGEGNCPPTARCRSNHTRCSTTFDHRVRIVELGENTLHSSFNKSWLLGFPGLEQVRILVNRRFIISHLFGWYYSSPEQMSDEAWETFKKTLKHEFNFEFRRDAGRRSKGLLKAGMAGLSVVETEDDI